MVKYKVTGYTDEGKKFTRMVKSQSMGEDYLSANARKGKVDVILASGKKGFTVTKYVKK